MIDELELALKRVVSEVGTLGGAREVAGEMLARLAVWREGQATEAEAAPPVVPETEPDTSAVPETPQAPPPAAVILGSPPSEPPHA